MSDGPVCAGTGDEVGGSANCISVRGGADGHPAGLRKRSTCADKPGSTCVLTLADCHRERLAVMFRCPEGELSVNLPCASVVAEPKELEMRTPESGLQSFRLRTRPATWPVPVAPGAALKSGMLN